MTAKGEYIMAHINDIEKGIKREQKDGDCGE